MSPTAFAKLTSAPKDKRRFATSNFLFLAAIILQNITIYHNFLYNLSIPTRKKKWKKNRNIIACLITEILINWISLVFFNHNCHFFIMTKCTTLNFVDETNYIDSIVSISSVALTMEYLTLLDWAGLHSVYAV